MRIAMRKKVRFFLGLPALLAVLPCIGQTLPVGIPLLEDAWRQQQISGMQSLATSFTIRPVDAPSPGNYDSLFLSQIKGNWHKPRWSFAGGKGYARPLPVTLQQQYNSHHPYGWNDGSMIAAKGYQTRLSAGVFGQWGPLSLQLQPELVFAANPSFSQFPQSYSDSVWKAYYYILNRIDNPERYGNNQYFRLFPGQSSLKFRFKKMALGISTENLWWGPGIRNSIIMSNNAPGFAHITFNSTVPVKSPIGTFEWQLVGGKLKSSGILPPDTARKFDGQPLYVPKPNDDRYLNGLVVTWQPKWTPGLFLGFTRVFYQYEDDLRHNFDGYLPVIGTLFKGKAKNEDEKKRDQLLSVFFRLVLPGEQAEVYGEFARNDHAQNERDLLLEPEHARAYTIGLRKIFPTRSKRQFEILAEMTQTQTSSTAWLRAQEGWYTHYQVRHGYTNRGQVMGAGIGPGSNSQMIGLRWLNGIDRYGISLERIVRNNDFYYKAIGEPRSDYGSHWTDIAFTAYKNWSKNGFVYAAHLSYIRSLNYQWNYTSPSFRNRDVGNLQAGLSVSYLF